jgi:hypothetical protein
MRFRSKFLSINPEKAASLLIAVIFGTLFTFKLNVLLHLRPVADDYCFAASLNDGFIHSLIFWYQSVQFDFFVLVSNLIFVGIPIQEFSTTVASLSSFLITIFILIIFTARNLRDKLIHFDFFHSAKLYLLLLAALLTFFWLQPSVFIFASSMPILTEGPMMEVFSRITQHSLDVTNSWTFWGVVNSSYLIPFLFSFWFILKSFAPSRLKVTISIFCGVLVGTSGYVIAATTLVTILLLQVTQATTLSWKLQNFRLKLHYQSILEILPTSLAIILGSAISFFSPGGAERRNALKSLPQSAQVSLQSFPVDFARLFAEVSLNLGNLSAVLFGLLIGILFGKSEYVSLDRVNRLLTITGLYFFVCFGFTIASEFFSYRAYWHSFTLKFDLFIFLIALGVRISFSVVPTSGKKWLMVVTCPILLVGSLLGLVSQIENRYASWSTNINYGAISSLGDNASWVQGCYLDLKSINPRKYYPEFR